MKSTRVGHIGTAVAVFALVALNAVLVPLTFGNPRQSQAWVDVAGAAARGKVVAPRPTMVTIRVGANSRQVPARTSQSRIALGREIFFDARLSEPSGTSCASCHAPARAFSGNNGSQIGVARGSRPNHFARRNTPSLLYLKYMPQFHFYADDEAIQPSPFGGFFWDGRADSIAALVREPLLDPNAATLRIFAANSATCSAIRRRR